VFFFAGIQLFVRGLLGEYIGAIHFQVRRGPLVIERERESISAQRRVRKSRMSTIWARHRSGDREPHGLECRYRRRCPLGAWPPSHQRRNLLERLADHRQPWVLKIGGTCLP
jgi:hypothetical protein